MNGENPGNRSWQEIVASYDELILRYHLPLEPMRELVHRLATSPSACELLRNTSMHTLLVSNAPSRSWSENVLRITFLPTSQEFEFEYSHYFCDTNATKKRCSISEAWDMLARFVRYKFGTLLPDKENSK